MKKRARFLGIIPREITFLLRCKNSDFNNIKFFFLCVGCEECLEVCVFNGMEMIDNKAVVNQKNCLGCGRCETTCPNDAISISITDISYVDKLIKDLEAHVEVS